MAFMDKDAQSPMTKIKKLDDVTPENLKEKYTEELVYWRKRFEEVNLSMQRSVYGVFSGTLAPVFGLAMILSVGGAFGLVYALPLHWWWGIPIFLGIYLVTVLMIWVILPVVLFIGGSRKARGYADVLLVSSLLQLLLDVFQDDAKGLSYQEERKERIVRGIEESAKWLRCLPLQFPSKDKALKDWYCRQMDKVTSQLLALRLDVIMSRLGYTDELRKKLMTYFDAALCHDYSKLLDEEVKIPPPRPLNRTRQVARLGPILVLAVSFIVLLVTDLVSGGGLEYVEALSGTGGLTLVTFIYQFLGGKQGIAGAKTGMDVFNQVVSNTKERR